MTHYSVVVATRSLEAIPAAMAPFDENGDVAPYRRYLPGEPADFIKAAAFDTDLGLNPEDPTLTWAKVAAAYNQACGAPDVDTGADIGADTGADIDAGPGDGSLGSVGRMYLDDDGRPYEISTANPQARWDYWRVGGRWRDYFPVKDTVSFTDPNLVTAPTPDGAAHVVTESADGRIWVPGGAKRLLDLDRRRDDAALDAAARYEEYAAVTAGLPEAKPRSWFTALVKRGDRDIEQARAEYRGQRRVQAAAHLVDLGDCPIDEFGVPRDVYIERCRGLAVAGYATLTLDGRWLAPGLMGWFAMSTDDASSRAAYAEQADAYIDALPEDVLLVAVDCHT